MDLEWVPRFVTRVPGRYVVFIGEPCTCKKFGSTRFYLQLTIERNRFVVVRGLSRWRVEFPVGMLGLNIDQDVPERIEVPPRI